MRRTASPLSLILLGLGTFLLVLAPLLAWYVEPRAAVNPIDIDTTAVYRGTGSVFDTERVETVPDQRITVTQRVRGNVAESERSGNAVWDVTTTVDTDKSLLGRRSARRAGLRPAPLGDGPEDHRAGALLQGDPVHRGRGLSEVPLRRAEALLPLVGQHPGRDGHAELPGYREGPGVHGLQVHRERPADEGRQPHWCREPSSTSPTGRRCWPRSGTPTTASS